MKISNIKSRKILNSRGKWTIEVTVKLENKFIGTASVPQGKSKGSLEAHYVSPEKAIKNIKGTILPYLKDKKIENQNELDKILLDLDGTENKCKLGANSILGTSFAFAKAKAKSEEKQLWQYLNKLLGENFQAKSPKLMVNMINGGSHAGNKLDFQEYLVIPQTNNIQESIKLSVDFYQNLKKHLLEKIGKEAINIGDEGGFAPPMENNLEPLEIFTEIAKKTDNQDKFIFAIDAAANEFEYSKEKLTETYLKMIKKFPFYSIEDPFKENEFLNFASLKQEIGDEVTIIGDDLTVTNAVKIEEAHNKSSVNGVIIKPNQIGTLTETVKSIKKAKKYNWKIVVSHRSGETNDSFITDLAYAAGADAFKLGAPARGERIAKYNRLLKIKNQLLTDN